jgi:hypothetical protein
MPQLCTVYVNQTAQTSKSKRKLKPVQTVTQCCGSGTILSRYGSYFSGHWKILVYIMGMLQDVLSIVKGSFPDSEPDPHVFGPPGSGSFYNHAKIVRKTLLSSIL